MLTSLESVSVKTAETTTAHREAAAGCTILKKNANPVPLNGRGRPKTGGKRFKAIQEMKQDAAKKKQRRGGEQQEKVNRAAPIVATSGSTGGPFITGV